MAPFPEMSMMLSPDGDASNLEIYAGISVDAFPRMQGLSADERIGLILAFSSSVFIGASFVLTKKGLLTARFASMSASASEGGYSYLREPVWWCGLLLMAVGECANFVAYSFAPPILVTPLGAMSIITSAALADRLLGEKLCATGWMGCALCIIGSCFVVGNAPEDEHLSTLPQLWMAIGQTSFILFAGVTTVVAVTLMMHSALSDKPELIVLVSICSLVGSLSVMSCKVLGMCLRLTLMGNAKLIDHPEMWLTAIVVGVCIIIQMKYLNSALDAYDTAIVTPIYYVLFTTLTLAASFVLFQEWAHTTMVAGMYATAGFAMIAFGVFMLMHHGRSTKEEKNKSSLQP